VTVEKLLGLEDGQKEAEPERLSLRLAVSDYGTGTALDIAARLRSQFLSAGITLQVENLSMEEMGKRLQDGDFDLAMIGYQLGNSADLRPLLHSEGENNVMGYKSDAMDTALDALLAADSAERYQLAAQRVYAQIQRDLPIYTLIMRTKTRVTAPGLLAPGMGRQGQSYRGIENWSFDTDN
jgi:ABC-type oligopeptide transport system substrate-binding subunit